MSFSNFAKGKSSDINIKSIATLYHCLSCDEAYSICASVCTSVPNFFYLMQNKPCYEFWGLNYSIHIGTLPSFRSDEITSRQNPNPWGALALPLVPLQQI